MKLIESKTLGTAAASIEFTSIPQDGTDLVAFMSLRGAGDELQLSFNNSTTSFSQRYLRGAGSGGVASFTVTRFLGALTPNTATANTFGNSSLYIPNYSGSTNKSFSLDNVTENNSSVAYQEIGAGLWSDTSAITTITFNLVSGLNLLTGSTISLYKITKGSDGIVTTS
jgi:hypothetical protein